jgi:aspartyl-tRNA(Asn)/glutamyl-tRNA(Gln) amidotransferase subunit C
MLEFLIFMSDKITKSQVKHVAKLANLQLTSKQVDKFQSQLSSVLEYVSKIQNLDTSGVKETAQVTNLENITREDEVDEKYMLTQEQALGNAKKTHDGFFVVDHLLNNKDAT